MGLAKLLEMVRAGDGGGPGGVQRGVLSGGLSSGAACVRGGAWQQEAGGERLIAKPAQATTIDTHPGTPCKDKERTLRKSQCHIPARARLSRYQRRGDLSQPSAFAPRHLPGALKLARNSDRKRRGRQIREQLCPFPATGLQPEVGPTEPRKGEMVTLSQVRRFDSYLGLGIPIAELKRFESWSHHGVSKTICLYRGKRQRACLQDFLLVAAESFLH